MVLKVFEARSLDFDLSRLEIGDVLVVRMARGVICLQPIRDHLAQQGIKWSYLGKWIMRADQREIDRLKRSYPNYNERDMRRAWFQITTGHPSLDYPLSFDIIAYWEGHNKHRPIIEHIGRFQSRGGAVRTIVPTQLNKARK